MLNLNYLLHDVVERQRPLDWDGFWKKQATQVWRARISYFEWVASVCWQAIYGVLCSYPSSGVRACAVYR